MLLLILLFLSALSRDLIEGGHFSFMSPRGFVIVVLVYRGGCVSVVADGCCLCIFFLVTGFSRGGFDIFLC